ncbi:MAG: hypothetical protein BWY63_03124 [Chloroflexi bacterium ADurb.Bin360]|nr:MAG: hypothetical protein BWY63_03124 [Chloroflexi bacterium ADurb.Bin360]
MNEKGRSHADTGAFEALLDNGIDFRQVIVHRGSAQTITDNNLYLRLLRAALSNHLPGFSGKLAPQVRAQKILIPITDLRRYGKKVQFLLHRLGDLTVDGLLRDTVVELEQQQTTSAGTRSCPPHAEACSSRSTEIA